MNRSDTASAARAGLCIVAIVLAAACSSGGGAGGGGNPDLITRAQVEELPDGTAFTVVQRFRPRWLRARTQATLGNPDAAYAEVFLDDTYFGPIESLSRISSTQVMSMQYISALDATTRYGTGYVGGIIRVNTR